MFKRLLLIGAVSVALGISMRLMLASPPAVADRPALSGPATSVLLSESLGDGRPRLREVWTRPAPDLSAMALSSDGDDLAWVDSRGSVRRVDLATGRALYQTAPLAGINRIAVTASGATLVWSDKNPASPTLRLLHPKWGDKHSQTFSLSGAIWSVALRGEGTNVAVGLGSGSVTVLPLTTQTKPDPKAPITLPTPVPVHWKTSGIPESVAQASETPLTVCGTWNNTGIAAYDLDGKRRWQHADTVPGHTYRVKVSADGRTVLALSTGTGQSHDLRLDVRDGKSGALLFSEAFDGTDARAFVSENGERIALSYARTPAESGQPQEYRLVCFDRMGIRTFRDKGSGLFRPQLVALSPDGETLTVLSGTDTLFTLDSRGNFVAKLRFAPDAKTGQPATVREVVSSEKGRYLLVSRGDGQMTLLKSVQ